MAFKYPANPEDWQTSYTEKQAFADSLKRGGYFLIPIVFILMIPIFSGSLYFVSTLINIKSEYLSLGNPLAATLIAIIAPMVFYTTLTIFLIGYLLKIAETFLKAFYKIPDSVDLKKLVNLRVFGCPPMPPPLSAAIKFPTVTVKNGRLDPQENWHTIIGGPVKLKIEPGNAVYLERGNRFSRVVGQGMAFLELHETIKTVLNTGPQSEELSVTAWTRDGICIKIKAKGEYFLGLASRNENEESLLYPYDPASARIAVEQTFANGKEGHEWIKIARGKTTGSLSEYISNRYLEEIFIASANGGQLFSTTTMNDLLTNINSKIRESGICLSLLQITDVELPEQITRQRIRLWETGHKTHQTITESEVKAYQLSSRKKALAEMVHDFVLTLANGLERMERNNLTEKILSSIYEVINQGMKDPLAYLKSTSKIMPDGVETPEMDFDFGDDKA